MITCYVTKEKVNKSEAYKTLLEGHKRYTYFKNESIYNKWLDEQKSKDNVKELLNKILGKSKYSKINPILSKKLNIWLDSYSYKEIEFCLELHKNDFFKYKSKGVPYLSQVIENKLIENNELYELKKTKENINTKIEFDYVLEESINNHKYVGKGRDITKWILE